MSDAARLNPHVQKTAEERSAELDIEVWKHFAAMGAIDKNTMITTVSWLLAFAAAAIGYVVTDSEMIGSTPPRIQHPVRLMTVSVLGIFVSLIACYLAVLYGGYSNRNWAKADKLAQNRGWLDLLPEAASQMGNESGGKPNRLAGFAWERARPCDPQNELAPVFKIFLFLALLACLTHGVFFAASLYRIVSQP